MISVPFWCAFLCLLLLSPASSSSSAYSVVRVTCTWGTEPNQGQKPSDEKSTIAQSASETILCSTCCVMFSFHFPLPVPPLPSPLLPNWSGVECREGSALNNFCTPKNYSTTQQQQQLYKKKWHGTGRQAKVLCLILDTYHSMCRKRQRVYSTYVCTRDHRLLVCQLKLRRNKSSQANITNTLPCQQQ